MPHPLNHRKGGDELCANVTYLGSGGLELLVNKRLTVGFLSQNHTEADIGAYGAWHRGYLPTASRAPTQTLNQNSLTSPNPPTNTTSERMLGPCRSSTYAGADIFLSTHWGQRVAAGYDLSAL